MPTDDPGVDTDAEAARTEALVLPFGLRKFLRFRMLTSCTAPGWHSLPCRSTGHERGSTVDLATRGRPSPTAALPREHRAGVLVINRDHLIRSGRASRNHPMTALWESRFDELERTLTDRQRAYYASFPNGSRQVLRGRLRERASADVEGLPVSPRARSTSSSARRAPHGVEVTVDTASPPRPHPTAGKPPAPPSPCPAPQVRRHHSRRTVGDPTRSQYHGARADKHHTPLALLLRNVVGTKRLGWRPWRSRAKNVAGTLRPRLQRSVLAGTRTASRSTPAWCA